MRNQTLPLISQGSVNWQYLAFKNAFSNLKKRGEGNLSKHSEQLPPQDYLFETIYSSKSNC